MWLYFVGIGLTIVSVPVAQTVVAAETTPPTPWDLLLGPYGLTAGAVLLVMVLLRELRRQYEARLDEAKKATLDALAIAKSANEGYQTALEALRSGNVLTHDLLVPDADPAPAPPRRVRRTLDDVRDAERSIRRR